jgi:Rieske Fe-S protein
MIHRRAVLKILSVALTAIGAAVVAVPGVSYLLSAVRRRESSGALVRRVVRLEDLPVGRPVEAPIVAQHQDAWTTYPNETIDRVWLVRRTGDSVSPAESRVDAFASVCPHLGCSIQVAGAKSGFVCPCHRATFDLEGQRTHLDGQTNHSPRNMDSLACRLVEDDASGQWWVEVTYQKFERGLTRKIAIS